MKRHYQPPRIEIARVTLFRVLLSLSATVDSNDMENGGKTSEIDEEGDDFIHAGAKQRSLWDDVMGQ